MTARPFHRPAARRIPVTKISGFFRFCRHGTSTPRPPYLAAGVLEVKMTSTRNLGRVAGFWYLLLIVVGPLRLIYIPEKLFVLDNAAATVNNIAAHEWLFRVGMVSELVGALMLVFL